MKPITFNIPILLISYNRPHETEIVLKKILQIKPAKLFIFNDGSKNHDDKYKVDQVRNIISTINNAEVKLSNTNLGCKMGVSTAINWFFSQVKMGIILEDDCVPNDSFFNFCQKLLIKYQSNKQVMHISGNNFQNGIQRGDGSYYFSQIPHIWGWATWKRAWSLYDLSMTSYPLFLKNKSIKNVFSNYFAQEYWLEIFNRTYQQKIDTWDYQWTYTLFNNHGVAINPAKNLVSNIGFGPMAVHTKFDNHKLSSQPTYDLKTVHHPKIVDINMEADDYTLSNHFNININNFIYNKIIKPINRILYPLFCLRKNIFKMS